MYPRLETLNDEERKFIEENHGLIYSFLKKNNLSVDEYYDIAVFGFIEAVKKYNSSKGSFSSIAYVCMLSTVRQEMRKSKFRSERIKITSLDVELKEDICIKDLIPSLDTVESIYLHNEYVERIEKLPEKLRTVVILLASGYNQVEIAKRIKCSQSYVSRLITKALKGVKGYE